MFSDVRKRAKKAGQPPGTLTYTGDKSNKPPVITYTNYNDQSFTTQNLLPSDDLSKLIQSNGINWINVEGLNDVPLIEKIAKQFNLHPLTIEDVLNVEQRPKVEEFDGYLFITFKILLWDKKNLSFTIKQISLVIGKQFVLTFQEVDTTLFDAILSRLQTTTNQRLRQQGTDYLAYRMIDTVVDQYFVVLEALGDQIEAIEEKIVGAPTPQNARIIYRLKRQMLLLRKIVWPMREALNHLLYAEDTLITKYTRMYLRDVYDHAMQAIDTIETFRDILSSMLDMYLSSLTIRTNEIMKTMTIITTIFIPIAALAGIYGMNLPDIPLMKSHLGFPIVATLMVTIAWGMLMYFRKKKWI